MSRVVAGALVAGLLGVVSAGAQAPAKAAEPELVGTWTGIFKTEMGGGTVKLVVARQGDYSATFAFQPEGAPDGAGGHGGGHIVTLGPVTDFKVDGKRISWAQEVMGGPCKGDGELKGAALNGWLECEQFQLKFSLVKS